MCPRANLAKWIGLDLSSFPLPLFFFFPIQDIIKSEERQQLAKERREEKAKYLGKWILEEGG